jgi:hypothetical protein
LTLQQTQQEQGHDAEETVNADLLVGPAVHRPPAAGLRIFQGAKAILQLVLSAITEDDVFARPSDKVEGQKLALADWLRTGMLPPVHQGENGLPTLPELGEQRSDHQQRFDACDESPEVAAGAALEGTDEQDSVNRARRWPEVLYQPLDGLRALRRSRRPEFLAESRKHKAAKLLRQVPASDRFERRD